MQVCDLSTIDEKELADPRKKIHKNENENETGVVDNENVEDKDNEEETEHEETEHENLKKEIIFKTIDEEEDEKG